MGVPETTSATPDKGPRLRSRDRYERRLDDVVTAATRVFAEKGFDATTTEDLMAATGLQRGGLYHYMSHKQDLLVRIHQRLLEPLLADVLLIHSEPHEAGDAVRLICHALARNLRDYNDEMVVFLHEWRKIRDDPAWAEIRRGRRDLEHVIERALRRGAAREQLVIADPRIAALGLLGMFNHAHQWFRLDGRVSAEELAEGFADIFLLGVQGR